MCCRQGSLVQLLTLPLLPFLWGELLSLLLLPLVLLPRRCCRC